MAQNRYYSSTAAKAALQGPITSGAASMVVNTTTGWPSSFPFTLILERDTANEEVVQVTSAPSGSAPNITVPISRGIDNTGAIAHSAGATVEHGVSARDFNEPQVHLAASAGVHGLTGTVVGTTDTQTLSNKTLTSPVVSQIVNTGTLTLPTSTDTMVGRATTDTLTNKTLTAPTINGTVGGTASLTGTTLTTPTISGAVGGTASFTGTTLDATSTVGGVSGTTLAADHAAWQSYTPVLTASVTNPTLGAGSFQSGRYLQMGKTVICQLRIQFGTSGTAAGNGTYFVSLPVAPISSWANRLIGSGDLFHASGSQPVTVHVNGTAQTVYMGFNSTWPGGTSNSVTHINLWGWSTSDIIDLQFAYEAA